MKSYIHAAGTLYRIMEGVRRAKAAHMSGHSVIQAEVVDPNGQSLGTSELALDTLRSPKVSIRRITSSDETRWNRVIAGAVHTKLPFPPIIVQPSGDKGTKIADVDFDFGGKP